MSRAPVLRGEAEQPYGQAVGQQVRRLLEAAFYTLPGGLMAGSGPAAARGWGCPAPSPPAPIEVCRDGGSLPATSKERRSAPALRWPWRNRKGAIGIDGRDRVRPNGHFVSGDPQSEPDTQDLPPQPASGGHLKASRQSSPPPDHDSDERAAGETGVVEWDIPCTARVRDSSTPVKARTTDRRVPGSAFGPDAPEAVGPAVPDLAFEDSLRGVFGPPSPRRCSVGSEGAQPPASLRRALTECGPKGYAGLATKRASDEPVDRSANAPVQRAGLASSTRSRNLSISRISARRPT